MKSESASVVTNQAAVPSSAVGPLGPLRPGLGREARLAFAAVAVFSLLALLWPQEADDTAPMGNLVDAGGQVVPLASQTAAVTLVHFWSTWCPPCITETPAIQRLAADYEDNPRFRLVMVAVSDDPQKVKDFLGPDNPGLFDPNWKVARSYGTQKLPETHLVVRGRLVESYIGAVDWDDPVIRRQIEDALGMAVREEAEEAEKRRSDEA